MLQPRKESTKGKEPPTVRKNILLGKLMRKRKSTTWQPGVYQYTYDAEALSQISIARDLGTNSSGVFEIHASI
jgi:hypothetical protein